MKSLPERYGPELEQPWLDACYRVERWWASAGRWLSGAGLVILLVSNDYRAPYITLLSMSILCQLISWRAMRGAQRLEKRRIDRLVRGG